MRRLTCLFVLLTACGAATEPSTPTATPKAPSSTQTNPAPPPGSLWREDVNRTVEQGLGYFLQRVEVDAEVRAGRFEGFRIVSLLPADYWQGVDLKPGDVVTSVNGMPIERETEAYAAFESLKTASAIRVQYRRDGQERELVYSIVSRSGAQKAEPPGSSREPESGGSLPEADAAAASKPAEDSSG